MEQSSGSAMTFDEVVLGRRGIRGYKPDPVPKSLVREVIATAMRAPSSLNTQPWNLYVLNSQGIMQSPVLREHAAMTDDQVIMICVAMGYPDDSFPANAVVSRRKSVDEAVVFVRFDD
jgi:nitroreductase